MKNAFRASLYSSRIKVNLRLAALSSHRSLLHEVTVKSASLTETFLLLSERFADPVVGEARVLNGRLDLRHVAGGTVLRAYSAGGGRVIVGCFCAWLIDMTLQTA